MKILIARGSEPSGRIVSRLLTDNGVRMDGRGKTLSWGVPDVRGALNGASRVTKYQALEAMAVEHVPVPEYRRVLSPDDFTAHPVWYARKAEHARGSDIRLVCDAEEAAWRLAAGWDHFTARLPIARELRAWVFRDRVLAVYRKDMVRPEEFTRVAGRGHLNGFAFNRVKKETDPALHRALANVAPAAVRALGLDFGAVDVIDTGGNNHRVLEVNTAPGIDPDPADPTTTNRAGARRLAKAIAAWALE